MQAGSFVNAATWSMPRARSLRGEVLDGCVTLQVHGGINLRLDSRSSPKHRRVPSSEALRRMAQQHNSAIANPAIFSPIPEDFLKAPQQAPPLLPLSPALPEQLADVTR